MPRLKLMTLNLRKCRTDKVFTEVLKEFSRWRKNKGLNILCAQEHNIPPIDFEDKKIEAKAKGITLTIAGLPNGTLGTFILSDDTTTKLTNIPTREPGVVRVEFDWGGESVSVASVYCPSTPKERIEFLHDLPTKFTPDTFVGGDWDCVPDVTLDVKSANPLKYKNYGSSILADGMKKLGLIDERREQLGNSKEYTFSEKVSLHPVLFTSTRLDRWYTPSGGMHKDKLLTFSTTKDFHHKPGGSDHSGVILIVV